MNNNVILLNKPMFFLLILFMLSIMFLYEKLLNNKLIMIQAYFMMLLIYSLKSNNFFEISFFIIAINLMTMAMMVYSKMFNQAIMVYYSLSLLSNTLVLWSLLLSYVYIDFAYSEMMLILSLLMKMGMFPITSLYSYMYIKLNLYIFMMLEMWLKPTYLFLIYLMLMSSKNQLLKELSLVVDLFLILGMLTMMQGLMLMMQSNNLKTFMMGNTFQSVGYITMMMYLEMKNISMLSCLSLLLFYVFFSSFSLMLIFMNNMKELSLLYYSILLGLPPTILFVFKLYMWGGLLSLGYMYMTLLLILLHCLMLPYTLVKLLNNLTNKKLISNI